MQKRKKKPQITQIKEKKTCIIADEENKEKKF
jgi:hypothetical protein